MTGDLCLIPDSEGFTLTDQIGTGSFAVVYKAIRSSTKTPIAIKSYRMKLKDRGHFLKAATEMALIRFLNHPNIISYVCSNIQKYYMYLGIEYSPYGCLLNLIEKRSTLPEQSVQVIMKQVLSAVSYLHNMCIFHGDIKPENIIIIEEKSLKIKLTDFGLSEVVMRNHNLQKKSGSFFYMSPEIQLGFPADYTSDLFSTGILMYEMLYGFKPFPMRITKEEYLILLRKRTAVKFPEAESALLSPQCLDLVKNLLSYDKDKRLSGVRLVNHPFLRISILQDKQNHYVRAYECFINAVDLVKEKKYGAGYIAVIEAALHLQIHSIKVLDTGLHKYVLMKYQEFSQYGQKIIEKLVNNGSDVSLEMQSDTEKLRCLLVSSPELLAAYDLCVVGEMYYMQHDLRGRKLIKNGLQTLLNKISLEPEGQRRRLLGAKMAKWMSILEDSNANDLANVDAMADIVHFNLGADAAAGSDLVDDNFVDLSAVAAAVAGTTAVAEAVAGPSGLAAVIAGPSRAAGATAGPSTAVGTTAGSGTTTGATAGPSTAVGGPAGPSTGAATTGGHKPALHPRTAPSPTGANGQKRNFK